MWGSIMGLRATSPLPCQTQYTASLSEDIKEHLWPFISFYSAAITLEKPDLSLGAFRKDGPSFKIAH